ncbi:MAG: UDP-N-acetylmuramoyl-L-alanyl-D-glutamate--2,6-diaminopimelate ligase [Candidatus Omnitrophica bacterium]|nr:UDP-N-acetylmuramoyl-L-alanyl-D-glutamate--2,6-diaminopimelate ligase [Candidatus Omnitrophota bacterium]
MELKKIIKILAEGERKFPLALKDLNFIIKGISSNSKLVKKDYVFLAIKGTHLDGNKFIPEAVKNGAKAVIVMSPKFRLWKEGKVLFIGVKDTRKATAALSAAYYGMPSSKIKVVGITGTNGKTTVSYLIEAILKEAGLPCAVIGTVNYRFKNKIVPSKNTTPGPVELQALLSGMLKDGARYAAMEVSSHALDQGRTDGIGFHSAIFTNLTQDHLDYHRTLDIYFQAKAGLFKGLKPSAFAVINNDDAYAGKLKRLTPARIVTYGIENKAEFSARDIKMDVSETRFVLVCPGERRSLKVKLIGRHNVYNILAAVAWARKEGIAFKVIQAAVEKFHSVPGRLQKINFKGDFSVFVDYAHTEDALKNVLQSLKKVSGNKIIVVFGCGGERDKTKRPLMGKVVSELADYAVITNDNPRSEDPADIIEDIKRGIIRRNYDVITDRRKAIEEALKRAGSGDIVLVAGKGHENYQILNDKTLHFDDREAVRECLKKMNY